MHEPITDGDLRNPLRRHARLVEEDAAEVIAIGEDLGLQRQEGAAGVDEIDAGQAVLQRDLLRAQVLLHRHREVGAALHRRVVGDDHHLASRDAADAGDEAGGRRVVVVHVVRGERRQLEKRRAGIEQPVDALAHRQLALLAMPLDVLGAAAVARAAQPFAQLGDQLLPCARDWLESADRRGRCESRASTSRSSRVLKPQAGQRQTACMRYISAPQRSQSILVSPAGGVLSADLSGVIGRATGSGRVGVGHAGNYGMAAAQYLQPLAQP